MDVLPSSAGACVVSNIVYTDPRLRRLFLDRRAQRRADLDSPVEPHRIHCLEPHVMPVLRSITEYTHKGKRRRLRLFAAWQNLRGRVSGRLYAGNGCRAWKG